MENRLKNWIISRAVGNGWKREDVILVLDKKGLSNRELAQRAVDAQRVEDGVPKAQRAVTIEAYGSYIATGSTDKLARGLRALGRPGDQVEVVVEEANKIELRLDQEFSLDVDS